MFCGALAKKELKGFRHKINDWMVQNRYVREFHFKVFACMSGFEGVCGLLISFEFTRASHGCRHSPAPMSRVGQGSTSST